MMINAKMTTDQGTKTKKYHIHDMDYEW